MTIFTIKENMIGKASILNGKLVTIDINYITKTAKIRDIENNSTLLKIHDVESVTNFINYSTATIYTKNDSFTFTKVNTLIPTTSFEESDSPLSSLVAGIAVEIIKSIFIIFTPQKLIKERL